MGSQEQNGEQPPPVSIEVFIDLCRKLNDAGVCYLVYGGFACILHGHVRVTEDIDLCVGEDRINLLKALKVLSTWGEGWARELTPEDVVDNVVVRIGDIAVVDLAARMWKLDWNEAWKSRRLINVQGVTIPVISRAHLIQSKQTYREQDAWDIGALRSISEPEPGHPAAL